MDDLHEHMAWQQAKSADNLRALRKTIEHHRKELDQRIVEDAMGGLLLVDEDVEGDEALSGSRSS